MPAPPASSCALGNPADLYQRLLDAACDTVEERFQISAGGRPIAEVVRTTSGDETLYLHTDRLGSAETISTSSGQTFDQRFDPFGAPDPSNTNITRAGFTGHAHDNDLGLIDMKGRVYDPLASRFTTADPIMQAPHWSQGMNRYAYVFNDPINATDPSGFISMSDVVKGFVTAGHVASAGLFAYGAITSGNAATTNFAAVGGSTGGSSALTLPGLQGQPGSSATVEDVSGNMAGPPPRSSLFDPEVGALAEFLCQFPGIATCDEAGVRMNLLIPDVPVGPVPVASQTASWWGRLKNWVFGRAAHRDLRPKCQSD